MVGSSKSILKKIETPIRNGTLVKIKTPINLSFVFKSVCNITKIYIA